MPIPAALAPPRPLVGLVGAAIQRSLSPALHEREARHHGLDLRYHLIDLAAGPAAPSDLAAVLDAAALLGFAGLNITHPCKQAVVPLLDELSPDARAIGAVNTVVLRGGRRIGHNTDWSGFATAFASNLRDVSLREVALFGAGGAGAAVAHALMRLGAGRLRVVDLAPDRARELVERLERSFGSRRAEAVRDAAHALAGADGVVHATPTGMDAHAGVPFDTALLRPSLWVAEIVYFPLDTPLLVAARGLRCRAMDGGGMAVGQAAGAFELFTGIAPDAARMSRHFRRLVREPRR